MTQYKIKTERKAFMDVKHFYQEVNNTNNFYCDADNGVANTETSGVMTFFKYGSVLALVAALGYGAFLLVAALVAWLVVAVPALLATVGAVLLVGLQVFGVIFFGYWAFVFLGYVFSSKDEKQAQKPTIEAKEEVIDVKVLEKPSEKRVFSLENYEKLSEK